jgi:ubiquitin fusion degradation protein 1
MPSHKTFKIKIKLAKKAKQNRPVPVWFRYKKDTKIRYNNKTSLINTRKVFPCTMESEDIIDVVVHWRKQTFHFNFGRHHTVADLKHQIEIQTGVPKNFQKILIKGLGNVPEDFIALSSLKLPKPPITVLLIGSQPQEIKQHLETIQRNAAQTMEVPQSPEDRRNASISIQQHEDIPQTSQQFPFLNNPESTSREGLTSSAAERTGYIEFILKCYSFAFANKKTLSEVGDKVILPASKLHDFENNRIPFPFTFQLLPLSSKDTNNNNAKITEATSTNENASKLEMTQTHCGVLDFTAPNETAYLPHHMMTKLNIDEGDAVLFRSVVLPQGSFAKFQPHSIQWIEIDEVERKRILESQLRKYQTLSLHDLVVIEHQNVTYFFTVLELKPSSAVCILDSDLEVDIEEPVDLQKIQIVALEWDKPAPFDLSSKNYFAFFSVHVDDVNTKLMIKMMPEEGTATFYVSTTRKYPSKSGFQWSSDDVNNGSLMNSIDGSKAVIIDQTDASFIVGSYYIGVYAIAGNRCKGTIVVTNYKNSAFQQTLKTIQTEPLEDSSQCPNWCCFICEY